METIRVFIADDDPLVRTALAHIVSSDPQVVVVGQASNGKEALEAIERLIPEERPNVVMMDVSMPVMGGVQATEQIKARWPEIKTLAVTTFDNRDTVIPMLRAGASGYLLKESKSEDIRTALLQTHSGETPLSPRIAGMLVEHLQDSAPTSGVGALAELTEREQQVLEVLAQGMSNSEMAGKLNVSEGTVKAHLGSIMSKWDVRDRVQVLVTAAKAGLVRFR